MQDNKTQHLKIERLTKEINHNQRILDDYFKDKIKNTAKLLAEMAEGFNEYSDHAHHYTTGRIKELTELNNRAKEVMNKLDTLRKERYIARKELQRQLLKKDIHKYYNIG